MAVPQALSMTFEAMHFTVRSATIRAWCFLGVFVKERFGNLRYRFESKLYTRPLTKG